MTYYVHVSTHASPKLQTVCFIRFMVGPNSVQLCVVIVTIAV